MISYMISYSATFQMDDSDTPGFWSARGAPAGRERDSDFGGTKRGPGGETLE
jgi:hypothetical protein